MATEAIVQTALRALPDESEAEELAPALELDAQGRTVVKKKDLIDRIVLESGLKKNQVKPVVEATLAVMGLALSEGEVLNIRPLGKVQVNRKKELVNGEILHAKIRRPQTDEQPAQEALADPQ